jgi:hypothetical protein
VIKEVTAESPEAWFATLRTISVALTKSTVMQRLARRATLSAISWRSKASGV